MFHLKLNDESGTAMIVAVSVAFVGAVVASAYMGSVVSESTHSVWQKHRAQSLFLAEAGVQRALYHLNSPDDKTQWEREENIEFPEFRGNLGNGNYRARIRGRSQKPWLPERSFYVESTGTIPRDNSEDIERNVSCVVVKLDSVPVGAAISIFDWGDPTPELMKFQSNQWVVDGRDHNEDASLIPIAMNKGVPAVAVANDTDDVVDQMGLKGNSNKYDDQVIGMRDIDGIGGLEEVNGAVAIIEDPDLPHDLDAYGNYFREIGNDISGEPRFIPEEIMGTEDELVILYANLDQGDKKVAAHTMGWGILVLEGDGEFEMAGQSWWNGLIICVGDSQIDFKGGGATPAHVNGALMIADGTIEMNGTADVLYCSAILARINAFLLLYQVYAWCDGWGEELGSEEYWPVTEQTDGAW